MTDINRILIIHPEGNTFNNPTLKCIVDLLLEKSISVTIKYSISNAPMPGISGIKLLPQSRIYKNLKNLFYNWLNSWALSFLIVYCENFLFICDHYDLIIAVDREGLIEAAHLKKINGTPFVFFSFEIMFESETSRSFKLLEKKASKYASHWFVQDEIRADCLRRENALSIENCSLIPLASSGVGQHCLDRLRDQLGIPLKKKVALLMGSLANWSMAEDIISSTANWPVDWVLVVHDRYGCTRDFLHKSKTAQNANAVAVQRVYWSDFATEMVDDMGFILAGVSVGLSFYRPENNSPYTGMNLEYLGLSSGKIATFLRYGIPLIMNDIGLYSELARKKKFGIVVKNTQQIGEILGSIDVHKLSENATSFFIKNLDFFNYKKFIWEKFIAAANAQ